MQSGKTRLYPALVAAPTRSADAEAISAVVVAALRVSNAADDPPAVIERIAGGLDPAAVAASILRRRIVAALHRDAIVGKAALHGATVRNVFVLAEARRLGVGSAPMAESLRMAEHHGQATLRLRSSVTAQGFCERLGFRAAGDAWFGEERSVPMGRNIGAAVARDRRM